MIFLETGSGRVLQSVEQKQLHSLAHLTQLDPFFVAQACGAFLIRGQTIVSLYENGCVLESYRICMIVGVVLYCTRSLQSRLEFSAKCSLV